MRARYHVDAWSAPSPARTGLRVADIDVPGLSLRRRTDHLAAEGGITLAFGPRDRTTLVVRVSVAPDAAVARWLLRGVLQSAQNDYAPLADRLGADVAFGDTTTGAHAVAAVFGNVFVDITRTHDAGAETPSAVDVFAILRHALAAPGTPVYAVPTLTATPLPGDGRAFHVTVRAAGVTHVEARVRGGTLRAPPGPAGFDVHASARGPVEVTVIATDALGRVAMNTLSVGTLRTEGGAP